MNDNPGRRRNIPGDPTSEPASDPVPTGDDVIGREENQPVRTPREEEPVPTPRRYDESGGDDVVMPSDDSTLNTQI
jgi:hypothetical protein